MLGSSWYGWGIDPLPPAMLQLIRTKRTDPMATYNQATDLQTRQTVWVGTVSGRDQANSHTRAAFTSDGISAAELAGLAAHAYRNDVRALQWG
jgi:hypothetical protein